MVAWGRGPKNEPIMIVAQPGLDPRWDEDPNLYEGQNSKTEWWEKKDQTAMAAPLRFRLALVFSVFALLSLLARSSSQDLQIANAERRVRSSFIHNFLNFLFQYVWVFLVWFPRKYRSVHQILILNLLFFVIVDQLFDLINVRVYHFLLGAVRRR